MNNVHNIPATQAAPAPTTYNMLMQAREMVEGLLVGLRDSADKICGPDPNIEAEQRDIGGPSTLIGLAESICRELTRAREELYRLSQQLK